MELAYARYHKRDVGVEGDASAGVAKIGAAVGSSPAIVPRKVHRKELLTNEYLAKSLSCALCSDILDDPRSAGCGEGHSFCVSCLAGHFGESESARCPTCSKEIVKSGGQVNVQLRTLVTDLCVNCPSNLSYNCEKGEYETLRGGCGWKERFEDLSAHLKTCDHQTVECPGAWDGCPVHIWKWGLSGHMKNCTFRGKCECGEEVPVQDLEKHRVLACTKTMISCPHEKLGCEAKVPRPEVAAHLETCDFQRLRPKFLALEGKHTAEIAKLRQDFEVQLAAERAFFQQEVDRLRGQLLMAKQTGTTYQRGGQNVRLSQGGFARRAHALGLSSAEELELLKEHAPGKKRKRAGKGGAGSEVANGGGPGAKKAGGGVAAKSGSGQGTRVESTAVPVLAERVDLSQFVQVPEGSLFKFDEVRAGDGNLPGNVNGVPDSGQVQPPSITPNPAQNAVAPTPLQTVETQASEGGQPSPEDASASTPPQEQLQPVTTSAETQTLTTPQTMNQSNAAPPETQPALPMVSVIVPKIPDSLPAVSVTVPDIPTIALSIPIPPLPAVAANPSPPVEIVAATQTAETVPAAAPKRQPKKAKLNPSASPFNFQFAVTSKPGLKTCPWTPSCTKLLPQNANKCPECKKGGPKPPKPPTPAPPAAKRKCAACGELNPASSVTCTACNKYIPREYSSNKCSKCGRGNNGNARTCGACGTELRPKRVATYSGNTCPKCAHGNIASARKCKTCGHEMRPASLIGRLKL